MRPRMIPRPFVRLLLRPILDPLALRPPGPIAIYPHPSELSVLDLFPLLRPSELAFASHPQPHDIILYPHD